MGTLQIDPAKAEDNIEIKVYDDDFGAENFIGSYYLPVKEAIHNSGVGGVWYDLRDCKNGKICVSAQFNASDSKINKKEIVGMSQEEKAKENLVPEEKQNLDVKDFSRRESDYKPDSSVSEDEKKDKKETKKLRRESTESSSDDKSVSSSSEGDAEKEKNDVQET